MMDEQRVRACTPVSKPRGCTWPSPTLTPALRACLPPQAPNFAFALTAKKFLATPDSNRVRPAVANSLSKLLIPGPIALP